MSRAEAEMAALANQFHFNVTTDFGQAEQMLQDQIDKNRARVRVAADLSGEGLEEIQQRSGRRKGHGRRRAAGIRGCHRDWPRPRRPRPRSRPRNSARRQDCGAASRDLSCRWRTWRRSMSCGKQRAELRTWQRRLQPATTANVAPLPGESAARGRSRGFRAGHASLPSNTSPVRRACSCCTATCTT